MNGEEWLALARMMLALAGRRPVEVSWRMNDKGFYGVCATFYRTCPSPRNDWPEFIRALAEVLDGEP